MEKVKQHNERMKGGYMNIIRQGDVLLKQIAKIPNGAQKLKNKILAYGEITGHTHRFEEPKNIDRYEYEGKTYLQVYSPTPLIHEEHQEIIVPIGDYQQIQEREYNYIDEEMQKVVD
jgi:hypothetical protein